MLPAGQLQRSPGRWREAEVPPVQPAGQPASPSHRADPVVHGDADQAARAPREPSTYQLARTTSLFTAWPRVKELYLVPWVI